MQLWHCDHCREPFATNHGRSLHQRSCQYRGLSAAAGSHPAHVPVKAPRLDDTPSATAGRSQPGAPASPQAGAERVQADDPSPHHALLSSPGPCASASASGTVLATDGSERPGGAAGDSSAATRAIHSPTGEAFAVADVQQCHCPTDNDASQPGPAFVPPSDMTELEARTLRMLHKLPRSQHKELLQLVSYGRPSSAMPHLKTLADARRLLDACVASEGLGGVRPDLLHVHDVPKLRVVCLV